MHGEIKMKVSINWLKELVDLNVSVEELVRLLPLRTIGIKEITRDFIELDMKGYNRADLLSLRGVAYEVAAILNSSVKFRELDAEPMYKKTPRLKNVHELSVKVENTNLAPLYCLVKIEGLKAKKSPLDWQDKLLASGMRPVNNITDITNLIMIEYGQPLHAFDARAVKDEKVVVRTAKKGERITTLDGKTRDLRGYDLLIADPQNNLGIAGVMGGKDSEVSDSTSTILLEAAIFDPVNLRKTATRLSLQSEASKRFYHGLTKKRLYQALNAAIKMYQELGGEVTGISINDKYTDKPKNIKLTQQKVNSLIGIEINKDKIENCLNKLYFDVHLGGVHEWEVKPPYFRLDIDIEEDVIEEIARLYGYEKIPPKPLSGKMPKPTDQTLFNLIHNLKNELVNLGLTEVQTYSYCSTAVLNNLNYGKEKLIKISNPISSETEFLRNHLWPNLVEAVAKNVKQGFGDIAIFEIGKTYQKGKSGDYLEEYKLSIALLNGSDNPILELYQVFENARKSLKLDITLGIEIGGSTQRSHPTRYRSLNYKNKPVGKICEVHPRTLNGFGIEKRVAVIEINLSSLL